MSDTPKNLNVQVYARVVLTFDYDTEMTRAHYDELMAMSEQERYEALVAGRDDPSNDECDEIELNILKKPRVR